MFQKSAFFATVCLVSAVISMYFGWQQMNQEYDALKEMAASVDWPTTDCVVKASKRDIQNVRARKSRTVYAPVIVYTYNVDGKQRVDNRISFGEEFDGYAGEGRAEWVLQHYPEGSRHKVFYPPNGTGQSVLLPGVSTRELSIWGLLLILCGGLLIVLSVIGYGLLDKFSPSTRGGVVVGYVLIAGVILFAGIQLQKQRFESVATKNTLRRCEMDAYYLGDKKFSY